MCSDRKGNSHAVTKAKLRKIAFACFQSGNAVACKWNIKRDVITITNKNTKPEMVPVSNRHGDQKQKPSIFCDSNEEMSGIDPIDLMLLYDSALHKTLWWYKKVAIHFFEVDMFLVNTLDLYNRFKVLISENTDIKTLRNKIAAALLGPQLSNFADLHCHYHQTLADFHYLAKLSPTEKNVQPNRALYERKHEKNQPKHGWKQSLKEI